jgi:hypothetical protein
MRRLAWVWVLVACKSAPAESTATTTTASTTATAVISDVTWTMPAAWTTEPSGGMRLATYHATKASGDPEDATITVIKAGGTLDENVARWKAQFSNAHDFSRSEAKAGNLTVTTVEVHGTYTGGGMMVGASPDPRPGWALVGAIVLAAPQPYFFKMLGPDKTVAATRPDFQALVDSVRPK